MVDYVITNCDDIFLKKTKKRLSLCIYGTRRSYVEWHLNSNIAINVNIAIMRTFVYIRRQVVTNIEFNKKLEELESKYDAQFGEVFEALHYLIQKEKKEELHQKRKQIGFKK